MGDYADDLIEQGINEMIDELYPLDEDDEGDFDTKDDLLAEGYEGEI